MIKFHMHSDSLIFCPASCVKFLAQTPSETLESKTWEEEAAPLVGNKSPRLQKEWLDLNTFLASLCSGLSILSITSWFKVPESFSLLSRCSKKSRESFPFCHILTMDSSKRFEPPSENLLLAPLIPN